MRVKVRGIQGVILEIRGQLIAKEERKEGKARTLKEQAKQEKVKKN